MLDLDNIIICVCSLIGAILGVAIALAVVVCFFYFFCLGDDSSCQSLANTEEPRNNDDLDWLIIFSLLAIALTDYDDE